MGRLSVKPKVKVANDKRRVVTTTIQPTKGEMGSADAKRLYNDIIGPSIKKREDEGWNVLAFAQVLTKTGWITVDPANFDTDDYFVGRVDKTGKAFHSNFDKMIVTIISVRK